MMPLVKQHTWAQAAGKGLSSVVGNGPTSSSNSEMENDQDNSGGSASKVMRMEENVNESQMAAAYSEGWGQRGINQDTAWEVPSSPHLSPTASAATPTKEGGGSTWSGSGGGGTCTGTEIWENNVRHHNAMKGPGGSMKTQQAREPWGSHTPTTHIGGTWGEEEDTTNLWTGPPPPPPQASGATATWGGQQQGDGVWGAGLEKQGPGWDQGMGPPGGMNPNWSNEPPPALQIGLPHMPSSAENKNMVAMQLGLPHLVPMSNENKNMVMGDSCPDNTPPWATDPKQQQNRNFATTSWSPAAGSTTKKMLSGWEETAAAPPPPVPGQQQQQQSGGNYDDGTAVWGNPVLQGKVSHWKEMPANKNCGGGGMGCPPGNMMQGGSNPCAPHAGMIRLPQTGSQGVNPKDAAWLKGQQQQPPPMNRNMSWSEMQAAAQQGQRRIWDDGPEKNCLPPPNSAFSGGGGWGEQGQQHPMGPYWTAAKSKNANSWADGQVDTSSWGGPMKQGGKPLTKDLIWASKQFRLLMEMNFKKDDIENALRRSNMSLEEALMELHALNNKENSMIDIEGLTAMNMNQPRVHLGNVADDMNFSEHAIDSSMPPGNLYGGSAFPGMNMFSTGFNVAQNCKNQNSVGNNIAPNVLGNAGTNNQVPNFNLNNGINNLSPAMMRKLLSQTQAFNPACIPQNTGRMTQQNFPSTAQLRILVQQIQMAVQAGHLNPTILNQPLAPQTLQLLYQLLQQIRFLHQLQQQQIYFSQHGAKPGSPPLQLSVQITQAKQHIVNLQNQIASQQAIFLKQQVQLPVQHPSLQTPQPSSFDVVKTNLESMNGLHSEFRDLSVKEQAPPPSSQQGHSRLTQWKMSFDKDPQEHTPRNNGGGDPSNDFSRAPGSLAKSSSSTHIPPQGVNDAWPDMVQQQDQWSTSDPGDPMQEESNSSSSDNSSSKHNDGKDVGENQGSQQPYNLNDLVPEFEPGKPWKGSSRITKNFEDDPHVTPGSIAKSPLSLNSIKDSELFTWSGGKGGVHTSSSLTSSTWTFSPPPSSQNSDSSTGRSGNSRSWNNRPGDQDRMSWKGQAPMPKTSRPPPGMSGQNKPITSNWISNEGSQQGWSSNSGWENKPGTSNFLVLKNLTPQIDGSTLKTLCLQHGPLQLFHLALSQGVAVVRYSSREETDKARAALNNCVLSNTTILVDAPSEHELTQYLQGQMAWDYPTNNGGGGTTPSTPTYPSTTTPTTNNGGNNKSATANWNSTTLQSPTSDLWSFSSGSSGNGLWSMGGSSSGPGGNDHNDPCPLNSFLPGDLLGGGESI